MNSRTEHIAAGQWWEDAGYEFEVLEVRDFTVRVRYAGGEETHKDMEYFRDGTFKRA
jgi:hypothetical protein